jgi:hypothetical protein
MHCSFLATSRPCLVMQRLFLVMFHPPGAMVCPFLAMRRGFVEHRHPQRAMDLASFGHRPPKRATLSLFPAHRNALAAIPSGLREARRVLEATPCAFALMTSPK